MSKTSPISSQLRTQEDISLGRNRTVYTAREGTQNVAFQKIFFGHRRRVEFQFPNQGSNPCPLYWKHIVLVFCFFFSVYFYQLEANYFTILQWFLSYIDMNQPWVYMYSPSRSPLPPPSLPDPSGSSQCTRSEYLSHASNLGW